MLLIDADLRHPSVAKHLGIEGHAGLAHVLSGQMTPKDVVQSYWKPNLHILPAGKRPANASILLNSDTMEALVKQALTQYDYVLIDTAPMTVSNDGVVFGRLANGIVLVTGKGVTEKKDLQETAGDAQDRGGPGARIHFHLRGSEEEPRRQLLLLLLRGRHQAQQHQAQRRQEHQTPSVISK